MIHYVGVRGRLWTACGLTVGAILLAWDILVVAPGFLHDFAVRNDLRLDYAAAQVGLRHGYGRLYDLAAQREAILNLGTDFNVQMFISPPPLAWLVTPLTALPFVTALVVWTAMLLAALVWTWWLLAPGGRLARVAYLGLWLGLFPVAFGVLVGQPGGLVAAAVATAWWLVRKDRQVAAGVALSVLAVKPQLALLVPLCLLVARYRRTFIAWLAVSAVIGLVALALLGVDGVTRYREALAITQGPAWEITRRYSVSGPLGLGPVLNVVQAVVVLLAVTAAWRHRGRGPEIPIAAGIAGSLLFSPYLGFQDLLMLVVAAWLVIRSGASTVQVLIFVAGYALLELAVPVLALPTLLAEFCLLLSLVGRSPVSRTEPAAAEAVGSWSRR